MTTFKFEIADNGGLLATMEQAGAKYRVNNINWVPGKSDPAGKSYGLVGVDMTTPFLQAAMDLAYEQGLVPKGVSEIELNGGPDKIWIGEKALQGMIDSSGGKRVDVGTFSLDLNLDKPEGPKNPTKLFGVDWGSPEGDKTLVGVADADNWKKRAREQARKRMQNALDNPALSQAAWARARRIIAKLDEADKAEAPEAETPDTPESQRAFLEAVITDMECACPICVVSRALASEALKKLDALKEDMEAVTGIKDVQLGYIPGFFQSGRQQGKQAAMSNLKDALKGQDIPKFRHEPWDLYVAPGVTGKEAGDWAKREAGKMEGLLAAMASFMGPGKDDGPDMTQFRHEHPEIVEACGCPECSALREAGRVPAPETQDARIEAGEARKELEDIHQQINELDELVSLMVGDGEDRDRQINKLRKALKRDRGVNNDTHEVVGDMVLDINNLKDRMSTIEAMLKRNGIV